LSGSSEPLATHHRASTTGNVADNIPSQRPFTYGGPSANQSENARVTAESATPTTANRSSIKAPIPPPPESASPSEASTCSTATTVRNVPHHSPKQKHLTGIGVASEDEEVEEESDEESKDPYHQQKYPVGGRKGELFFCLGNIFVREFSSRKAFFSFSIHPIFSRTISPRTALLICCFSQSRSIRNHYGISSVKCAPSR
jgi:hypothetical protein